MSEKTYSQFNSLTITGRVSHAEVVEGQYGEFLAVTLLTELADNKPAIAVKFNIGGRILGLGKKDMLKGRTLTVTGHLGGFTELYFDKKLGKTQRLQRPRLDLVEATVFSGGLGPAKKQESGVTVDPAEDLSHLDAAPAAKEAVGASYGTPLNPETGDIDF